VKALIKNFAIYSFVILVGALVDVTDVIGDESACVIFWLCVAKGNMERNRGHVLCN